MRYHPLLAALALTGLVAVPAQQAGAADKSLPITIKPLFNATCIAPANLVLTSSCDGDTFSSYVAESTPAKGPLEVGGTTFQWEGSGLQQKDVILAAGQVVQVPEATKGYRSVAGLMAAKSKNYTGPLTVTYTDGISEAVPITVVDWKAKQGSSVKGVRTQYVADAFSSVRYPGEGAIGLVIAPINKKRTVKSITLPSASMHALVFALSLSPLEKAPASGPTYT